MRFEIRSDQLPVRSMTAPPLGLKRPFYSLLLIVVYRCSVRSPSLSGHLHLGLGHRRPRQTGGGGGVDQLVDCQWSIDRSPDWLIVRRGREKRRETSLLDGRLRDRVMFFPLINSVPKTPFPTPPPHPFLVYLFTHRATNHHHHHHHHPPHYCYHL